MTDQTYRACQKAAERIGRNCYAEQLRAHLKAGRKVKTFRFNPTAEHRHLVALMGSHTATDEEAMAFLLYDYGAWRQRFPNEEKQ